MIKVTWERIEGDDNIEDRWREGELERSEYGWV